MTSSFSNGTKLPEAMKRLIEALAELPSIGPRQATRLAFHLVSRGTPEIDQLGEAILGAKNIKICDRCFFVHENEGALCDICASPARDHGTVMVIEKETDMISLENARKFKGQYCIVGAIPRTGIMEPWQRQRLETLKNYIERELKGTADEIILGFNPTSAGDFNASLIKKELELFAKKITRLGRGLPTGGEIEFADEETLGGALGNRM